MSGAAVATGNTDVAAFAPGEDGYTTLITALKEGNNELVRKIIRKAPCAQFLDIPSKRHGKTALHVAVENCLNIHVEDLLKHSASIGVTDNNNNTPLHVACILGKADTLSLLLKYAPDDERKKRYLRFWLDTHNNDGYTCFHLAVRSGHAGIIKALDYFGADVNAKDKTKKWTGLHFAADSGNTRLVNFLVTKVNVNLADVTPDGRNAQDLAQDSRHEDTAELLHRYQREVEQQGSINVSGNDSDGSDDVSLWEADGESMVGSLSLAVQVSPAASDESVWLANTVLKNSSFDFLKGEVGYKRCDLFPGKSDKPEACTEPNDPNQVPGSVWRYPENMLPGLASCINIVDFDDVTLSRTASAGLGREFERAFDLYGYKRMILCSRDETSNGEGITNAITKFVEDNVARLTNHSCVFTLVLSHGEYGSVLCSDGSMLKDTDILKAVQRVRGLPESCSMIFLLCGCQKKYPDNPGARRCTRYEAAGSNTFVMLAAGPKQLDHGKKVERVFTTVSGETRELLAA